MTGGFPGNGTAFANPKRKESFPAKTLDFSPERPECHEKVSDRTLPHPLNAIQKVTAAGKRQRRRERPCRCSGVAEEKLRAANRKTAAAAFYRHRLGIGFINFH